MANEEGTRSRGKGSQESWPHRGEGGPQVGSGGQPGSGSQSLRGPELPVADGLEREKQQRRDVNLNTASPEELARMGGLGSDRGQSVVQNRPFASWGELEAAAGTGESEIEDLKKAGATLTSRP